MFHFVLFNLFYIFAPRPRKCNSSGHVVSYALHRQMPSNFTKSTEDSNSPIYATVVHTGLYIMTANGAIGYFDSVTNRVYAIATAAHFTDTTCKACVIETQRNVAVDSVTV